MRHANWRLSLGAALLTGALASGARAITVDPTQIANDAAIDTPGQIEHCDDVVPGRDFDDVFECGDELFGTSFNAVDGVGGNVGDGGRFTRVPRTDQNQAGEWARHVPMRATGPNASSCSFCHSVGGEDGAGEVSSNNVRDPLRTNNPAMFIQRNPPHTFALGPVQLLAEQFNTSLLADVAQAQADAAARRVNVTRPLQTQGVNFGSVTSTPAGAVTLSVQGIDRDLIPKPFDWSGVLQSVRLFIRDASHQELGMNPVETAGDNVDGDFDGVVNEMTIADITALSVYQAAQPRPTTRIELSALRQRLTALGPAGTAVADGFGFPMVAQAEINQINAGAQLFNQVGCNGCHRPTLTLNTNNLIYREPSANPRFRENTFPAGQNAVQRGVNPATPITFNVTADQPDNVIMVNGQVVARLGTIQVDASGNGLLNLFGDLKRHSMGPRLAENINAAGNGASTFLTENLWGVGSTPQYLHDGRATTIREAIREHGGEAQAARDGYFNLNATGQRNVIVFLKNNVLFND